MKNQLSYYERVWKKTGQLPGLMHSGQQIEADVTQGLLLTLSNLLTPNQGRSDNHEHFQAHCSRDLHSTKDRLILNAAAGNQIVAPSIPVAVDELTLTSPDNGLNHRQEAGCPSLGVFPQNMPFSGAPNDSTAAGGVSFGVDSSDCVAIGGTRDSFQSPGELSQLRNCFCPTMSAGVCGQQFNGLDDLIPWTFDGPIMPSFCNESPRNSASDHSVVSPWAYTYSIDEMMADWFPLPQIDDHSSVISVPKFSSAGSPSSDRGSSGSETGTNYFNPIPDSISMISPQDHSSNDDASPGNRLQIPWVESGL